VEGKDNKRRRGNVGIEGKNGGMRKREEQRKREGSGEQKVYFIGFGDGNP